jgi:pimeloyl-ACP methyl ester carboxylesterase
MATFLMVHGAWHGGCCFDALRAPLEARGHRMLAPTLPGMGGTHAEVAAVTLNGWGAFVVGTARGLSEKPILVGHSRGGIVISTAAEQAPDAFVALVYLAAFMLPSGTTLIEARDAMPRNEAFETGLTVAARGAALAIDRDAAARVFYGDCSPADREAALDRLLPEPVAPLQTRLALSDARYGILPRHYVECTLDETIPLAQQRAMQAVLPCASVTTLESGHSPFLSRPDALATALDKIAERIGA